MSFISRDITNDDKSSIDKEIAALVKARGFEPGNYKFEPKEGLKRPEGSIINGFVNGKFRMEPTSPITFSRDDFTEKAWKKICASLGFKYHVHTDIDKLTILPASVNVDISIVTPTEEL